MGDMHRNNVQMKWSYEGKILHGDLIDFVCKQGYELSPSTPPSELSVQCNRGEVKYPSCIRKGKTTVLPDFLDGPAVKAPLISLQGPHFTIPSPGKSCMLQPRKKANSAS